MGAAIAFGNTLDADVVGSICSYLDDSSLLTTYGDGASDIGNMTDFGETRTQSKLSALRFVVLHNRHLEQTLYHGSLGYPNRL